LSVPRAHGSDRGPHGALRLPMVGKEQAMDTTTRNATAQVTRKALLDGVAKANKVTDSKAPQPILANVLIETTSPDRLTITATDFETALEVSIEAQSRGRIKFTVNAKRLVVLLKKLPKDADLEITHNDKEHWLTISSEGIDYRLATMPAEEFPPFPIRKGQTLKVTSELFEAMGDVLYAAPTDETRRILNGVCLVFDGDKVEVVATDGSQLALYEYRNGDGPPEPFMLTIPRKSVHTMVGLFKKGDAWMVYDEETLRFSIEGLSVYARAIEGQFPNYKQIMPQNKNGQLRVNRKDFIQALDGVAIMSSDRSRCVTFEPKNGSLSLSAGDTEYGSATGKVEAVSEGEHIKFGANAGYVLNALKTIGTKDVVVNIEDALSPIVMKPSDSEDKLTMVIMPMRM